MGNYNTIGRIRKLTSEKKYSPLLYITKKKTCSSEKKLWISIWNSSTKLQLLGSCLMMANSFQEIVSSLNYYHHLLKKKNKNTHPNKPVRMIKGNERQNKHKKSV